MTDCVLRNNLPSSFAKFSGPLPSFQSTSSVHHSASVLTPAQDFSFFRTGKSLNPRKKGLLLYFSAAKTGFEEVKARLKKFETPLEQLESLLNYGPLQLVKKFGQLPEGMKTQVGLVVKNLSVQFFDQLIKEGKMGLLEEGADWYMEYYTLQAFKKGILKQEAIDERTDLVKFCLRDSRPVEEVLNAIQLTLMPEQVAQFRSVLALKPGETDLAKELLAALMLKFTLQQIRGESSNGEAYTRSRIGLEAQELSENLAKHDPYCPALVRLNNALFSTLPLPSRLFNWLPQKLLRHHLAEVARPSQVDVLRYSAWKQAIRNSVNYHTLPKHLGILQTWSDDRRAQEYQKRKSIFKVFEIFFEAFVLKMAKAHDLRKAA